MNPGNTLTLTVAILAIALHIKPVYAHSGDTVYANSGISPVIDGIINLAEWSAAGTVRFPNSTDTVTAYFLQDSSSLFIALNIPDNTNNSFDDCGFHIDPLHNGGTSSQSDDFLFRMNRAGNDKREGSGPGMFPGNVPTGWEVAIGNIAGGWQVEYKFDFAKFGIPNGIDYTLGLFIHTWDDAVGSDSDNWPSGNIYFQPDIWADLIIQNCIMPTASFSHSDTLMTVSISDSSSGATGWVWDFGDSNTDTVQNPTYTYANAGTYNICLVATNACGSDTFCDSITIMAISGVEDHNHESKVRIVPNPFDQTAIIEFENEKNEKSILTLYNAAGQILRQIDNISGGKIRIERGNLMNGLYFFQLRTDSEIIGKGKVIIE